MLLLLFAIWTNVTKNSYWNSYTRAQCNTTDLVKIANTTDDIRLFCIAFVYGILAPQSFFHRHRRRHRRRRRHRHCTLPLNIYYRCTHKYAACVYIKTDVIVNTVNCEEKNKKKQRDYNKFIHSSNAQSCAYSVLGSSLILLNHTLTRLLETNSRT